MKTAKETLEEKGIKDTLFINGQWVKGGLSDLMESHASQFTTSLDKPARTADSIRDFVKEVQKEFPELNLEYLDFAADRFIDNNPIVKPSIANEEELREKANSYCINRHEVINSELVLAYMEGAKSCLSHSHELGKKDWIKNEIEFYYNKGYKEGFIKGQSST